MNDDRIAIARQDVLAIVANAMRAWFEGDQIDGDEVRAAIDRILKHMLDEDRGES
jgi:hypothetical protein